MGPQKDRQRGLTMGWSAAVPRRRGGTGAYGNFPQSDTRPSISARPLPHAARSVRYRCRIYAPPVNADKEALLQWAVNSFKSEWNCYE